MRTKQSASMWVNGHSPTIPVGCWRQRSDAKKEEPGEPGSLLFADTISGLSAAPDLTQAVNRQIEQKGWRLVPVARN